MSHLVSWLLIRVTLKWMWLWTNYFVVQLSYAVPIIERLHSTRGKTRNPLVSGFLKTAASVTQTFTLNLCMRIKHELWFCRKNEIVYNNNFVFSAGVCGSEHEFCVWSEMVTVIGFWHLRCGMTAHHVVNRLQCWKVWQFTVRLQLMYTSVGDEIPSECNCSVPILKQTVHFSCTAGHYKWHGILSLVFWTPLHAFFAMFSAIHFLVSLSHRWLWVLFNSSWCWRRHVSWRVKSPTSLRRSATDWRQFVSTAELPLVHKVWLWIWKICNYILFWLPNE